MKRFIIFSAMLAFVFSLFSQASYLVKPKPEKAELLSGSKMKKQARIGNKDYTLVPSYPGTNNPELLCLYDVVINEDERETTSILRESNLFERIEMYGIAYASCENPVDINDAKIVDGSIDNYALNIIEATCAWSVTKGDERIILGIADTDFQETHEDLCNQIVSVKGEISAQQAHGTHVAGAAAAEVNNGKGIAGVGYNTKVAGYRIKHTVNSNGSTTANSLDIKNAIWQAFLDGCRIINVSWTGTGLDKVAVQDMVDNGTTLVLAAGNSSTSRDHSTIANIPGVIVVSSSNKDDEYYTGHARNEFVDVCAPGRDVALTGLNNSYLNGNGTSFATPLVAGTVALMLAVNPCLTPAEIEEIIEDTADPLKNADLYPGLTGSGRLNAYAAVDRVMSDGTTFIQNTQFNSNHLITAETMIKMGNNVNSAEPTGNVVVYSNANLTLRATKGIEIGSGFEIRKGAVFTAECYEPNCY